VVSGQGSGVRDQGSGIRDQGSEISEQWSVASDRRSLIDFAFECDLKMSVWRPTALVVPQVYRLKKSVVR